MGGKPPLVVVAPVAGVFAAFGFFFSLLLRICPLDMMVSFAVGDRNLLSGLYHFVTRSLPALTPLTLSAAKGLIPSRVVKPFAALRANG